MLVAKRLIWKAPIIALTALTLALASYFLAETTFALNSDGLPFATVSLHHQNNAQHILAQATSNAPLRTAPTDAVPNHIIEQYKAYVTDLASVGTGRK